MGGPQSKCTISLFFALAVGVAAANVIINYVAECIKSDPFL